MVEGVVVCPRGTARRSFLCGLPALLATFANTQITKGQFRPLCRRLLLALRCQAVLACLT